MCPPFVSLLVSALFRWPCTIVSKVCHWRCPPFSAGNAAFLFIYLAGLSLVVSAVFRWQCSICLPGLSLLVSALSVGHVAFPFICLPGLSLLFLFIPQTVYRYVGFSAGHAAFSKVVSLLLSPRFGACTARVHPFPLAMQHFYSFVSHVICLLLFPRFGACTAGLRPFSPFQRFYSFVSQVISALPQAGDC